MSALNVLTADEAAELAGVTPASFRSYVSRGSAPRPDGKLGGTPYWQRSTITKWLRSRPGQGVGGGRPPKVAEPWTVFLGGGVWTHAASSREAARTLCGRPTDTAREWFSPGSEPGCKRCFNLVTKGAEQ